MRSWLGTFRVPHIVALAIAVSCSGCIPGVTSGPASAAWGPSLLPPSHDYYPPLAREEGLTGRVGLECSVDGKGKAQDVVVSESGGLILDDAARKLFTEGSFLIPPDWSSKGGPGRRFSYGVVFRLKGKPNVVPFDDHRMTVLISGSQG